jgi:hypothetical protein
MEEFELNMGDLEHMITQAIGSTMVSVKHSCDMSDPLMVVLAALEEQLAVVVNDDPIVAQAYKELQAYMANMSNGGIQLTVSQAALSAFSNSYTVTAETVRDPIECQVFTVMPRSLAEASALQAASEQQAQQQQQ